MSIAADQVNVAGDMVAGDKVDGDKVLGDKNVYEAPAPIAFSLHQLPTPPSDFVGREQEIADILRDLDKGAIISGVYGMGGIGKTALALVIADRLKVRYPDAQFFLDLRGASDKPMSPADAMAHVVRAYYPTSKLPDDGTELQGLYRSVLDGKKALVLMDNAKDEAQITPLLPPATCLLLITSRQHFAVPGLRSKDLNVLPPDKARELLISIADRIGKYADDIAKLCGYLPQALRAAASLIAATIDLDPADYLTRLRDEHTRLENISVDPNRNISVEASLNLSYASLSPDTQRVFGRLSVFPASFDAAAEEVVCEDTNHADLSQLVKLSLVQYDAATKRYNLHDLTRLFADARLSDDERAAALRRHAQYFAAIIGKANQLLLEGGKSIALGLTLFDSELINIQRGQAWAAQHIDDDEEAASACSWYARQGDILDLRLHPRNNIQWLESGLQAAHKSKNKKAEGTHLGNLGIAYEKLGEYRRAIEYHEQALAIFREVGDRRGEGQAVATLGIVYKHLSEYRRAIEYSEQALAIFREVGDRRGEGNALNMVGTGHQHLGEYRDAIEYCDQALKIAQEIGDQQGKANALNNLGIAYQHLGEACRAIKYSVQAFTVYKDLGDRRGKVQAFSNLGDAHQSLSETRRAVKFYEQALTIAREIGGRLGEANALYSLAICHEANKDRPQAITHAQAALDIFTAIESPDAQKVRDLLAKWK